MVSCIIIDGYVDEPTCLGVPPYISPYPRYTAGALYQAKKQTRLMYLTIDQLRDKPEMTSQLQKTDIIIVIAGTTVPGRYLSGYPASPKELIRFLQPLQRPLKILAGPAAQHGFGMTGGKKAYETTMVSSAFDLIVPGDIEQVIYNLIKNRLKLDDVDVNQCRTSAAEIGSFAVTGASLVKMHPNYPKYIIAEIETYRGCSRTITGGCSFCTEPHKGPPDFRPIKDILNEIKALYQHGIRHFRLGKQPCIFSYQAKDSERYEFPMPNPEIIQKLFQGIRTVAPNLKTLHIDNANPGVIARFPQQCKDIAKTIIKHHTSGDVAAFGVESVDPTVIKANNLKAHPDEILNAIKLLNKIGSKRGTNGLPELLPGINFVFGLQGETKKTFQLNYDFLKTIQEKNLLVRRINLRQVIPLPKTKMYAFGEKNIKKHKQHFHHFKQQTKTQIEQPLLKKLVPTNTILTNVYTETYDGNLTLARQLGSYPLLVGIPGKYPLHEFYNVKIIDHGYRSITGLPYPLDINTAPKQTIQSLPGIGEKRARRILINRPYKTPQELIDILDDKNIGRKLLEYLIK